jgi:hypothetical protein
MSRSQTMAGDDRSGTLDPALAMADQPGMIAKSAILDGWKRLQGGCEL